MHDDTIPHYRYACASLNKAFPLYHVDSVTRLLGRLISLVADIEHRYTTYDSLDN
jgi:hypothetical protein